MRQQSGKCERTYKGKKSNAQKKSKKIKLRVCMYTYIYTHNRIFDIRIPVDFIHKISLRVTGTTVIFMLFSVYMYKFQYRKAYSSVDGVGKKSQINPLVIQHRSFSPPGFSLLPSRVSLPFAHNTTSSYPLFFFFLSIHTEYLLSLFHYLFYYFFHILPSFALFSIFITFPVQRHYTPDIRYGVSYPQDNFIKS